MHIHIFSFFSSLERYLCRRYTHTVKATIVWMAAGMTKKLQQNWPTTIIRNSNKSCGNQFNNNISRNIYHSKKQRIICIAGVLNLQINMVISTVSPKRVTSHRRVDRHPKKRAATILRRSFTVMRNQGN